MIGSAMSARAVSTRRLPLMPGRYSKKECAISQIVQVLYTAKT
jgi:hypothetical protein